MQVQITARRFTASPDLQEHVNKKVQKLERFYDGITDARVILAEADASNMFDAELTLNVFKQSLVSQASEPSYEKAVDVCTEKMQRQIKRYKDRLRSTQKDAYS